MTTPNKTLTDMRILQYLGAFSGALAAVGYIENAPSWFIRSCAYMCATSFIWALVQWLVILCSQKDTPPDR